MYLFKVEREEWAEIYGDYAQEQCCFYQQSLVSSGYVSSISGEDVVVETASSLHRLKVKQCSQIYQLGSDDQRIYYKYERNFQNELSIQLALLFSDEDNAQKDPDPNNPFCQRYEFGYC